MGWSAAKTSDIYDTDDMITGLITSVTFNNSDITVYAVWRYAAEEEEETTDETETPTDDTDNTDGTNDTGDTEDTKDTNETKNTDDTENADETEDTDDTEDSDTEDSSSTSTLAKTGDTAQPFLWICVCLISAFAACAASLRLRRRR